MRCFCVALALLLVTGAARATTWAPTEKTDPLTGDKVKAWSIMSFGGYIYHWPSKYDQVFWPHTDPNWICMNPKNGYAAFNDDFEAVSAEERKALTTWLAENYKPSQAPKSHEEKLAWLEKVYKQRKMGDDFWCTFYRLMAYTHRGNKKKSLPYVKKALPLLRAKMKAKPKGVERIQVLYLLGEYSRRLGVVQKARTYFAQVKTATYVDEAGKKQTGHPYFVQLVEDMEKRLDKASGANGRTKDDAEGDAKGTP